MEDISARSFSTCSKDEGLPHTFTMKENTSGLLRWQLSCFRLPACATLYSAYGGQALNLGTCKKGNTGGGTGLWMAYLGHNMGSVLHDLQQGTN